MLYIESLTESHKTSPFSQFTLIYTHIKIHYTHSGLNWEKKARKLSNDEWIVDQREILREVSDEREGKERKIKRNNSLYFTFLMKFHQKNGSHTIEKWPPSKLIVLVKPPKNTINPKPLKPVMKRIGDPQPKTENFFVDPVEQPTSSLAKPLVHIK